jgi:DNA-binding MarR family transcriptional regulator
MAFIRSAIGSSSFVRGAPGRLTPAVLARLVGVAPSTLGPRLNGLTERGWVERRANPANSRSWLLQLMPAGWAAYDAAVPYAKAAFIRLDDALRDRGVDPSVRCILGTAQVAAFDRPVCGQWLMCCPVGAPSYIECVSCISA